MTRNLSIFNQLRPVTVGFDNIFDHFERMFDGDVMNIPQVNYPPYNIVKTGENTYDIELALAGFKKDEVNVYTEYGKLFVDGRKEDKENDTTYVHRGVAQRSFTRSWTLSDETEIRSVVFEDGLLSITLGKIVPDHHKRKDWF